MIGREGGDDRGIVFSVIDRRWRLEKPLIVTTNLRLIE